MAQHFQQALHIVQDLHFTPLALWILLGIGKMLLKTRQIKRTGVAAVDAGSHPNRYVFLEVRSLSAG